MPQIRITILDSSPIYTYGLKKTLEFHEGFVVSGCCRNQIDLLVALQAEPSDLVVLDLSGFRDASQARRFMTNIEKYHPGTGFVIFDDNEKPALSGISVKASICKSATKEQIITSFLRVRQTIICHEQKNGPRLRRVFTEKKSSYECLSTKEQIVLRYLQAGYSVTQTAFLMNRSVKTVSTQKRTAMKKLGLSSNKEMYEYALHRY